MANIWVKKPLSAYEAEMKKSGLKKVLGKWSLTAIGIGAIIGGGIFVLTGTGAYFHAGPALAISFIIAGIACVFAALCYGEFASIIPVEGSAYAYAYGTVGEIFAWAMGWCLILEYAMASMSVAVSWSGYFNKFLKIFGAHLPQYLTSDPASYTGEGFSMNLPAFIIVILITAILVKGTKGAASTNNFIVLLKTSAVIFVIVVGAFYVSAKNWIPFIPDEALIPTPEGGGMTSAYGIKGIISGAAAVFFAYIGFDAVSTQAGEAINPKKDVPFAIITSLLVCTALYIGVSLVLTGIMDYREFNPMGDHPEAIKAPVAYAFEIAGKHWAGNVITVAATIGLISVIMVMMMGQSRIFMGMAKDGLIPRFFGELHPKTRTPYKGIMLLGIVVASIAAFTPITTLADMTSFGTLFAFTLVCIAVWIMRKREPNIERPFKVPMYKVIVGLGVLINLYLILNLSTHSLELSACWLFLGILIYVFYSRKNSKLNNPSKANS